MCVCVHISATGKGLCVFCVCVCFCFRPWPRGLATLRAVKAEYTARQVAGRLQSLTPHDKTKPERSEAQVLRGTMSGVRTDRSSLGSKTVGCAPAAGTSRFGGNAVTGPVLRGTIL